MTENNNQPPNNQNREPYPHNAEQAVLAGLLISPTHWDDIYSRVAVPDFCLHKHRQIYAAMERARERGRPTDVVSVTEILRELGILAESGGVEYLQELMDTYVTAINIQAYADIVREAAVLRELLTASGEISHSVYHTEGRDAAQILDEAEAKVFNIKNKYIQHEYDGLQHVKPAVAEAIEYIQFMGECNNGVTGLSTGFADLDQLTTGLHGGELIIIAGRPSMGKTTFAMNIAESAAIQNKLPVAVFSLEMPKRQLIMRMLSSVGGINNAELKIGKITSESERGKLFTAVNQIKEAPLYIDDGSTLTGADLRARVRRLKSQLRENLGLVIVDYLQLMTLPMGREINRATLIGDLSRNLKLLAKEMDVPVIALSQLSRSVENRPDRRPLMSDLRESGAIEQDADIIMFVYRDEVYNDQSSDKGTAEIIVRKQRNGPCGTVRLRFEGQYLRFRNLTSQYGDSIVRVGYDE